MSKMRIAIPDRAEVKYECLQLLTTFKLSRDKQRTICYFIDNYLNLSETEMKSFDIHIQNAPKRKREAVMDMMTSWERKGFKDGEKKGRQKGRQEGRQETVLAHTFKLLTHQLGEIDQSLKSQISMLPPAKLESLFESALDFSSKEDLLAWLENP